jgi:lanosterol synthase
VHALCHLYEHLPSLPFISSVLPIRKMALKRVYQLLTFEDENTGYQTIGPVSKAFNMVARFAAEGAESHAFKEHMVKIENFLWMGKDGLMMCGTDGSQLWDLTFISQAMVETGLAMEEGNKECVEGMLGWLDKAQIRDNPRHYVDGYRHRTKGAWAFSTPEQGYVVRPVGATRVTQRKLTFR